MAATQAFLANRVSQGNLSASAAAAALRAMSPPPTPVADVQTKRMQRRSSSAGSANAARGRSRGGLDRKSSSGSMTERTFRSPSPGRPATPNGSGAAPPVPKLPVDIPPVPQLPERSSKRSLSLDTYGTRQESQPAPTTAPLTNAKAAQRVAAAPATVQRPNGSNGYDIQRTDSRNSVNFSRPLSPSPQSPDSTREQQTAPRNGLSAVDARNVQYNVAAVSQQPVKKKKKKVAPRSAEGSHLSSGSMASRPVVTPLEPGPEPSSEAPQPEPTRKKKKAALTGQSTHFPQSPESQSLEQDQDTSPEQRRRAQRASGQLMKQPSVVREDWEGEQEEEQSPVSSREEQGLSPVASPVALVQSKKTTAANMSRKIEEPITPPPKVATSAAQPETHQDASPVEADASHLTVQQPQPVRQSSLSPSRSTRFSEEPSDLAAGKKHEPLGRSVSPVKSALKHHSPAPGEDRSNKPRGSSVTPSDASDSNMSADGSVRRKKSVRVSFEPEPEVVGVASEPQGTDTPVLQSPQASQPAKKTGFFGLGRSRPPLTTIPSDDNLDEHMQPRPQLPSFGSIRNRQRRVDSSDSVGAVAPTADKLLSSPVQVSSTSSDASSSPDIAAQDHGVSSDHAVGAIFNQEATRKAAGHEQHLPLPPVVTSVEGGGHLSDTESEITVEDGYTGTQSSKTDSPAESSQTSAPSTTKFDSASAPITAHEESVLKEAQAEEAKLILPAAAPPALSVQPPTPGEQENKPTDQWLVVVPGGFPTAGNSTASSGSTTQDQTLAATTTRTFGPSEYELKRSQAADVEAEDESASDGDSIYSDAEEDLSDREGFGSIDAIVESPAIESPRQLKTMSPPQSPLAEKARALSGDENRASWDKTEQHWSGIAQQSREAKANTPPPVTAEKSQQASRAAPQQASRQLQQVVAPSKPKKKAKPTAALIGAAAAAAPPGTRQQAAQPVQSTTMRSSMRQQPSAASGGSAGAGTMRSSMRQQGKAMNAKGLQASKWAPPPAEQGTVRPQPLAASAASANRAALQKKHIPPTTPAPAVKPAYKPPPPPLVNDSDSDSSFRKARRNKKSADGSYNMRRSMRDSALAPPSQPAGRGAVRSLSPPARRPFSPVGDQSGMRMSMRGSAATPAPTLRGPPKEQKRSSSLFGRKKPKASPGPVPLPTTAGFRSRIGDSDDEDGPRPTTFKSRFADSSDDEAEPAPLRPVRGIPKRQDDGDSTDLDDSSDEERRKPKRQLQPAIKIDTNAAQQAQTSDVPLSPNTMKKKGLFSRFRSKKPKADQVFAQQGLASPTSNSRPATHDSDTPFDKNMGFGSSAERDAMIRQTMAKLEAAKNDEPTAASPSVVAPVTNPASTPPRFSRPQSPTGGKLQRRRPERVMSDSWPLPDTEATIPDDRPATAGTGAFSKNKTNGVTTLRPSMHERKPTNESLHTDGGAPLSGGKAKKKRFPMLRKAFGLKD